MSNVLGGCHEAREMKEIEEIMCPQCHTDGSIEIFVQDGSTVGESICDECGYSLEEGTPISEL